MKLLFGRWNSVQAKLLRSVAFALAFSMVLSGILLITLGNQNARTNMVEDLDVIANIIADRSAASLVFRDPSAARKNLSTAENKKGIEQLCLYDSLGQLFSSYSAVAEPVPCLPQQSTIRQTTLIEEDKKITVQVPVDDQGDTLGHLTLISNTEDLDRTQWVYASALIGGLLVSLLLALSIGKSMVARALQPLQELYKTSRVIARNPLSNERAQKISNDEFGRVVDVFNSMLDAFSEENKALTLSEHRFRSLSENSPVGVYLKSGQDDYQYINTTWTEITGLRGREISSFISRIDVRDRVNYTQCLDKAYETAIPQVVEYQFIAPSGERKALMEYVSSVQQEDGEPSFIGSLLDVTELKNAQMELEKLAFYDPLTQLPNRRFFP